MIALTIIAGSNFLMNFKNLRQVITVVNPKV